MRVAVAIRPRSSSNHQSRSGWSGSGCQYEVKSPSRRLATPAALVPARTASSKSTSSALTPLGGFRFRCSTMSWVASISLATKFGRAAFAGAKNSTVPTGNSQVFRWRPSTTIWLPRMTYPWPQTALPHKTQRASAVLSLPFMLLRLFRIWEPLTKFLWASIRHRNQAGSAVAAPFALDRDSAYVEPRRHQPSVAVPSVPRLDILTRMVPARIHLPH